MQVWYNYNSVAEENPKVSVSVDADYVLVGGGAFATNPNGSGAFLTKSWPTPDLTTWQGESKSHIISNPHQLYVFAIGMKIDGVSADYLRSKMIVQESDSSNNTNHPTITTILPSNYLLLGGGAWDDWEYNGGYGNMLVSSYPNDLMFTKRQWYAEGKDHRRADPSVIHVAAIGIENISFPNVGYLHTAFNIVAPNYPLDPQSGYRSVFAKVDGGHAITGLGGQITFTGYGRMIEALYPRQYFPLYEFFATSDQTYSDSGYTTAYVLGIQKLQ